MIESENRSTPTPLSGTIYANDVYSKSEVNSLINDPTYNTTTACVGYDGDILGGY